MRGWYFEGDHKLAGDFGGTWHPEYIQGRHQDIVIINGEKCNGAAVPAKTMKLSDCSYAGEWFRDEEAEQRLR
jgi:hypothetical protein